MTTVTLWMALATPAHAIETVQVKFAPCPPYGSCIQNLRAIDGAFLDWKDLEIVTTDGSVDPTSLRIELTVDQGAVDLWLDGVRLDPRQAEEVDRGVYAWIVPAIRRDVLHFESVNLIEGLSIYRVSVEGLLDLD